MSDNTPGRACAFCGSAGSLTKEHVFGDWLSKVGLRDEPAEIVAGALNQVGKGMGSVRPFQIKVKNVCATCNNGWMSKLEQIARRVLASPVTGGSGQIDEGDRGAVAAWVQKTALMAMYLSSAQDRSRGHGVESREYELLYETGKKKLPSPDTYFWVASYSGHLDQGAVWVTPVAFNVDGQSEPEIAHGYSIAVAVGSLLFLGLRLAVPLPVEMFMRAPLVQFWPVAEDVKLPTASEVSDEDFLAFAQGRRFVVSESRITLAPLRSAVDSPPSELVGTMLKMPTPCREDHFIFYPAKLAQDAITGQPYWFMTACECGTGYLVRVERDGAHVRAAGEPDRIESGYEDLPGDEFLFRDDNGVFFFCKRDESNRPTRAHL